MQEHIPQIAHELRIPPRQTAAVADLLADGATIPFISRYRKEVTGGLDEVTCRLNKNAKPGPSLPGRKDWNHWLKVCSKKGPAI
ncbi:MAG: hypothetical protein CSA26_13265 [Desulfobacterales bacterium]|nr:MAG: hypothetical protein CSA26_13265 [Desulfobacterales bacterium]